MAYILSIDQSTSATKALLFDETGKLTARSDLAHRQIVDARGWVEHDPQEILDNTLGAVRAVLRQANVEPAQVAGAGISNQRETALAWDRESGRPLYHAIVWQCPRGEAIARRLEAAGCAPRVQEITGLRLSPYFSAAKLGWLLEHVPAVQAAAQSGRLCFGTIDSWLLFRLTRERVFKTDCSNASRTQLFDIRRLAWSEEVCERFGVPLHALAEVCGSDALFGHADFGGLFPRPIPIHGVLGDSHGALFGQGCLTPGSAKVTYGTGSSVMLNTGAVPCFSKGGAVTSLAWGMGGGVQYVLEGNINYTGAVIQWLVRDLGLLGSAGEAAGLALSANPADETYLVPAFSGLGAPYWASEARASFVGMSRTTGRAELVRAAQESIAYQIADVVRELCGAAGAPSLDTLCADGGPTRDAFLMQFQADILARPLAVSPIEELSGAGAAYMAGIALGLYSADRLFSREKQRFTPGMEADERNRRCAGWARAIGQVLYAAGQREKTNNEERGA